MSEFSLRRVASTAPFVCFREWLSATLRLWVDTHMHSTPPDSHEWTYAAAPISLHDLATRNSQSEPSKVVR